MTKYVYDFAEGGRDLKDLLGGKGGNLAEMARLGLPVPPGFTITTDACRAFLRTGSAPYGLDDEIELHLERLEDRAGRRFGDPADPLLVSVRSGAKFSMPGMMETILDVGLTDATVAGLAARTGDERFAQDCYRRLIQMYGRTVCGIPGDAFTGDSVERHKAIFREYTGHDFPQDPREQLDTAIRAVFTSWNSERAVLYRRQERIPSNLGTAVNVVAMVFGNLGADSGTGVAFTRDPATGERGVYGDYLANAQGEDVVAGIRNTMPLQDLEQRDKASYDELMSIMATLEEHYKDLCDIEFTIERGKLWMLQTRVGKRTAAAAFVIASQLVDEGLIDLDEALTRVTGTQLAQLMFPTFDFTGGPRRIGTGVAASPGAAVGVAVFDSKRAAEVAADGTPVILVRRETNPDDLPGMIAAQGILTSRGGKTSHAAVVARGMGKTCVCGATLDVELHEGDLVSIDGTAGAVYLGAVPVQPSPVVRYFEGELAPDADPLVRAVDRLLTHADKRRRLSVRANADTAADAARARRFGAQGIGLCRTEHMFLGARRTLVERLILARTAEQREAALAALLPLQRDDFTALFRAMAGLPVTIRLIDPPLHEFLPPLEELAVRVARAEERGEDPGHDRDLLDAVHRLHEDNPMLGLRGVRLGLVIPGLFAMQVRAIAEAAVRVPGSRAEIMVPLVGAVQELETVRAEAQRLLAEIGVAARIGTMIEVPRAALTAGEIARAADFFSFGTNDLTQMGWGFSRDDVEGAFFRQYFELGIFGVSPFESIDRDGVGRLIRIAVAEGRTAHPGLHIGVCGEHGGDPDSVHFFHEVGLDYVSCSPFRVPVARLEAGRAAVEATGSDSR
ncbi:pyruvate, phosphate dikinase [Dactylosporangium matsuzakiense]|uniref:pyruvate, phosphate dikinase n=3 Tax=Dactylosporangium matsuzakiense TaxID=53360 RepID=UPI0021C2E609|nr:pyruvate, phosphate dikinase [Dactylosporangium matsuzakiense]UWZ48318.1 pyruvate, phosphate dikinase [Dactylosporangium matsuzakiense]